MSFKRLFMMTGDASGDVHGSFVIRQLQSLLPEVEIQAVGGEKIEGTGVRLFYNQRHMGVFGLGFLSAIPSHFQLAQRLIDHFKSWKPDAVLLIDYGFFNLYLAKRLNGSGIKVFYYIPPQVWASRPGRLKTIKRYIDHVFCIFPFEEALYQSHAIPVTYVGHPLAEQLPPPPERTAFCRQYGLNPELPIIGIFPGSRRTEIRSLLTPMIHSLPLIQDKSKRQLQFLLAQSAAVPEDFFQDIFSSVRAIAEPYSLQIIEGQNHAILALSQAALVASGTVTLEAALYQTPVVISYQVSRLAYHLFKPFVKVKYMGLPNLLSPTGEGFLPELFMEGVTPANFADAIEPYLEDTPQRQAAEIYLSQIKDALGNASASFQVVKTLAQLMGSSIPVPVSEASSVP